MEKILSASEVEHLKGEQKDLQTNLDAIEKDRYGAGTIAASLDTGRLKMQIKRLDKVIEAGTSRPVSGINKDRIARDAQILGEKIQQGMPTRDQMIQTSKYPGVVRKHVEWNKHNRNDIQRWKQMQRHLNPDDPTRSNIETLRKEK